MSRYLPDLLHLFGHLSDNDRCMYACLLTSISTSAATAPRRRRSLTFSDVLASIQTFVVRHDQNDAVRGLICGIYWLPDALAINIHQLRSLIPKSKSSINGSLQRLGFSVTLGRAKSLQYLATVFPLIQDNVPALRKWTLRKKKSEAEIFQGGEMGPERPRFEISLDGLGRYRPALTHEEESGVRECENEEMIRETGWDLPRNDDVGAEVYGTVTDYIWINNGCE
jgi:hypothetical protein